MEDKLPATRSGRLLGVTPEGRAVDNVTKDNRFCVNPHETLRKVGLYDEDMENLLNIVLVPSTREYPDIITFEGKQYIVVNTKLRLPAYRECMVLEAKPLEEEIENAKKD